MWREKENICCREIEEIQRKNLEAVVIEHLEAPPDCIVHHPSRPGCFRQLGFSINNTMGPLHMRVLIVERVGM